VTLATDPDIVVFRISGAFFFGAAATVNAALDAIAERPKAFIVDFSQVPVIDSTAAATVNGFVRKAERKGVLVYISGAKKPVRRTLMTYGLRPPRVRFRSDIAAALTFARVKLGRTPGDGTQEQHSAFPSGPAPHLTHR
jgi:SulP family sulfate permease